MEGEARMSTLFLLVVCLVGLGVFCSALFVMMMIWSYWIYKYPLIEEDDDDDVDYDKYW